MVNYLVTGGAGFIGSNFISYVLENELGSYDKIINIDRGMYNSRPPTIEDPRYTYVAGSIEDPSLIMHLLNKHEINYVVHFAAQTHVDHSFGNSISFTRDNILGTHTLLECCRAYGKLTRFLHISTDEVYGEVNDDHEGCVEESLLNPTNPYAATKAGAEFVVRSYGHSFNFPYIITRGNNVYGPRQFPDKVIPLFTRSLLKGDKCTIHGEGKTRRNFVHAQDVAVAVWLALHKGKIGEIYNIGSSDEFSVMEVLTKLVNIIHPGKDPKDFIEYIPDRAFNDYRYAINTKKLNELGWTPKYTFNEALSEVVNWYRENPEYWGSQKFKWLVYGHKGWIGQKVVKLLEADGQVVVKGEARVDDPDSVSKELDEHHPQRIISLIGRTHGPGCGTIDWLEEKGRLLYNVRDNLYGPLVLAEMAKERKLHFTYLGTGCIFTSNEKEPIFTEESLPNFTGSSYSTVKGFTDRLMKFYKDNTLNCRIRMPISVDDSPRNFITKITTYDKIHSVPNSMTVLENILPIMIKMAKNFETGTYNMTNPGVISHNEILEMYKEIIDPNFTWKNFDEKELMTVIKSERSNNELDASKLKAKNPDLMEIHEAVRWTLENMKQNRLVNGNGHA